MSNPAKGTLACLTIKHLLVNLVAWWELERGVPSFQLVDSCGELHEKKNFQWRKK